jgi:hypothetical protein
MASFCLDNCLYPPRHAFYQSLACFWWNFVPLLNHSIPQLMHSSWWPWVLLHSMLEVDPQVFYGVNVRGLGRPDKHLDVIVFKPFCSLVGHMLGVIVLLKDPLPFCHLQFFKTFYQPILQNIIVLLCIHNLLNLCELSNSIPPHTTPNHKVITPSMLDSRCDSSVC